MSAIAAAKHWRSAKTAFRVVAAERPLAKRSETHCRTPLLRVVLHDVSNYVAILAEDLLERWVDVEGKGHAGDLFGLYLLDLFNQIVELYGPSSQAVAAICSS
jgi:hypothetical protein